VKARCAPAPGFMLDVASAAPIVAAACLARALEPAQCGGHACAAQLVAAGVHSTAPLLVATSPLHACSAGRAARVVLRETGLSTVM
jgi:hypothetical protein